MTAMLPAISLKWENISVILVLTQLARQHLEETKWFKTLEELI